MTSGALGRAVTRGVRPPRDAGERCDLCDEPVPAEHAHLLDEQAEEPCCACRACALLFERDAAGGGRYRLVPDRRVRLTDVDPGWLGAPVGLAFFVRQPDGTVVAHYPSPLGTTRGDVDPGAWERTAERCPPLATMAPSVEALLVSTVRRADEQWLVPVSDCYRLVAVVRREWRGLSGGSRVWTQIEEFFADLAARSGSRGRITQ